MNYLRVQIAVGPRLMYGDSDGRPSRGGRSDERLRRGVAPGSSDSAGWINKQTGGAAGAGGAHAAPRLQGGMMGWRGTRPEDEGFCGPPQLSHAPLLTLNLHHRAQPNRSAICGFPVLGAVWNNMHVSPPFPLFYELIQR